jgi:hypothetical protein
VVVFTSFVMVKSCVVDSVVSMFRIINKTKISDVDTILFNKFCVCFAVASEGEVNFRQPGRRCSQNERRWREQTERASSSLAHPARKGSPTINV